MATQLKYHALGTFVYGQETYLEIILPTGIDESGTITTFFLVPGSGQTNNRRGENNFTYYGNIIPANTPAVNAGSYILVVKYTVNGNSVQDQHNVVVLPAPVAVHGLPCVYEYKTKIPEFNYIAQGSETFKTLIKGRVAFSTINFDPESNVGKYSFIPSLKPYTEDDDDPLLNYNIAFHNGSIEIIKAAHTLSMNIPTEINFYGQEIVRDFSQYSSADQWCPLASQDSSITIENFDDDQYTLVHIKEAGGFWIQSNYQETANYQTISQRWAWVSVIDRTPRDSWKPNDVKKKDDIIVYRGQKYIALKATSEEYPPDENTEAWKIYEEPVPVIPVLPPITKITNSEKLIGWAFALILLNFPAVVAGCYKASALISICAILLALLAMVQEE